MDLAAPHAALGDALRRLVPLTDAELAVIARAYTPCHVARKEMLQHAGEVNDHEWFVVQGCLRTWFIDDNGKEVTLSFAPEGWWAGDLASFSQRMPSRFFIQALEDTDLLAIRAEEKERLFAEVPALERAFRLAVQRHLSALQDRFVHALSSTAEVCYTDFLQKYPGLSERIPQHIIATYVGITPEFLSKLRSRISRGRK
ncbi:MAG: Crp/Fnr family transcriptional regulator [Flavobacteriales bacterium]|jgi:CRP-like cAMP-binding protein|nr:Crp/Fnr family transcriptional regulator [Flavobacteriales bacterium]